MGDYPIWQLITAYSENYTIKIFSPELKLIKRFQCEGKKVKVTNKDNHVFDKEGTFVGYVSLPSINSTAVFNKGYIYDLNTTNDEFPFLKRYSLK